MNVYILIHRPHLSFKDLIGLFSDREKAFKYRANKGLDTKGSECKVLGCQDPGCQGTFVEVWGMNPND